MVQECASSDEPVYEIMIDMAYDCPVGMPYCYTALKVRQFVVVNNYKTIQII